ncbi:MAG: nicotinate phosphoribosyltransferase [Armatimonadota bacterium]|nr:nicotinate phosphoribosyltransferase [Armatimonadota bacterium]MDR7451153.1 nicotinate phosphoribosyltransferase [Armatimonadota bacterium]MDR7467242.1 nicotinate phosphoribosyltransferase [Armatimonadota bacterium]MDR7494830.1 nicotinate phosphoribosyltransferase [Armatimonadota bacterium]MDR7504530.1 nicotinate phosphoribosyltransferase [Armatimonadota bacterium]
MSYPSFGFVSPQNMGLLTDLYELVMADSYLRQGMNEVAVFDLFIRSLPPRRSFLVSAGLESALYYLQHLRVGEDQIAYLRGLRLFSDAFLDFLRRFRFTGEVWAIPEGELFFPPEPVLEIIAPRIEAQLVETFLLNTINYQVMVASKAARVVLAAQGRGVIDFSPRRDHAADAALKAARAAYIAGCVGTSNVLAGMEYGIPVYGTMAHSYVMSFPDELSAFRAFARDFPQNAILLIDTYDTLQGARNAVTVAREMAGRGQRLRGVRIDSGDLAALSRAVRAIFDEAGLTDVQIILTGDLDEYRIEQILAQQAAVNAFGVGTALGTSEDAPTMGGVYKLVEDRQGPKIKLSAGKATLPGRKQVWRRRTAEGPQDVIALADESGPPGAEPLLRRVMAAGRATAAEPLGRMRERCRQALAGLPAPFTHLHTVPPSPVTLSGELEALQREMFQKNETRRQP